MKANLLATDLEKGVPLGANRRQIGKWEGKAEMLWGIIVLKRSHKLLEVQKATHMPRAEHML